MLSIKELCSLLTGQDEGGEENEEREQPSFKSIIEDYGQYKDA